MKNFLCLGAVFVVVASCGVQKKPKKAIDSVYGSKSLGIPVPLIISQKKCSQNINPAVLEVDLFKRGRSKPFQVDFSEQSNLVERTEFAGSFRGRSQTELLNSPDIENSAHTFEVCDIEGEYEQNTYQDAALSILAPIKNFENRFPELTQNLNLPEIKVRVAPLMRQGNKYLINNAFYYSGTREITFLPQGYDNEEDFDLPLGGKPLWKFPMVALHEYGHHIFVEKMRAGTNNSNLPPMGLCFDNSPSLSHVNQNSSEVGQAREVSKALAMVAVNEAFADIFAYYSEPEGRGLLGMGCMTRSRDIESRRFFNRDPKTLGDEQINSFLSPVKEAYTSCDQMTNFQDPHIIGAVFSRAIFKFLQFRNISDERKISILLEWVNRFIDRTQTVEDPKRVLKYAVDEFYQTANKYLRFDTIRCLKYYSHFSGITRNRCLR